MSQIPSIRIPPTIAEREAAIGLALRRWRIEVGLSQTEVAERAGLSRSAVQGLERGTGSRLASLLAVLRAIGRDDAIDALTADEQPSPIELLAAQRRAETGRSDAPRVPRGRR